MGAVAKANGEKFAEDRPTLPEIDREQAINATLFLKER